MFANGQGGGCDKLGLSGLSATLAASRLMLDNSSLLT